ncbi:MAG TPA: Fur family transcriptional regulator [Anaerolineales bacterium]|nr:Fur family transcriptional regulator [Anaerolineales bacterium]
MAELVEETTQRLHAQGGRMTSQRRLILQTLERLSGHPTAEQLFQIVRRQDSSLSLSTIYRTLRWLQEEDLVSTRLFDEERRQERFDPAFPSEHHHFMCTACKSVIEFDTQLIDSIKTQFERQTGAQVQVGSIVLYGLCARCREKSGQLSTVR